jgi:hypothetical protein
MFSAPTIFTDTALQDDCVSCGYFVLHFAKVIINQEFEAADWITGYMTSSDLDVVRSERRPGRELQALLGSNAVLCTYALTPCKGKTSPFFLAQDYSLDEFKRSVLWYVSLRAKCGGYSWCQLALTVPVSYSLDVCRAAHELNELQPASFQPYPTEQLQGGIDVIVL